MNRFRRLRTSEEIRRLVRETHVNIRSLIYPVFVAENIGEKKPVESMPEVYQYPLSELDEIISRCLESRIGGVLLFGIPAHKDESASSAYDDNGITQQAIRFIKKNYPELPVIAFANTLLTDTAELLRVTGSSTMKLCRCCAEWQ